MMLAPLRQSRLRMRRRLDPGPLEPREYRVTEGVMGSRRIDLACPHCGHVQPLPSMHVVHASGAVDLRWLCESEGCAAAEYLQLEDER